MASIAKASISNLITDSDSQLIVSANTVLAAIALAIVTFGSPSPALAIVRTALDDFIAALNESEMGGPEQTAIKNVKREELVALLRLLAFYVTVTCKGDIPKLLSSGFPIQEPGTNTPVGPLPTPNTPVVAQGPVTGSMTAKTAPVRGAGICNWRLALATAPTVYVQTKQTPGARVLFEGLTAGETYNVEVNAVGAAGTSNWSDDATMRIV